MNKYKIIILGFIFFIVLTFFYFFYFQNSQNYVEINDHTFAVELANSPAKQVQGYSNHPEITDEEGMLFSFPDSQPRTFWMKNMLFPLDIIWINGNKIINISHNLPPEGENPDFKYYSEKPANFVLEIKGGLADKLNIKIGDSLKIHIK